MQFRGLDHKTAQYLDEPVDICPLSPCSVLLPPPRLAPRVGGFMIKAQFRMLRFKWLMIYRHAVMFQYVSGNAAV